jgi:hypothetical protein
MTEELTILRQISHEENKHYMKEEISDGEIEYIE